MSRGPFIFPFLWMHGEDEGTIRRYIRAIHESNLDSFCVESRPHPDFVGSGWWRDMDIVLDEAERLGMTVWILDDSHFPTGFAAGAMKDAPAGLCRQSLVCREIPCPDSGEWMELPLFELSLVPPFQPMQMEQFAVDWSKTRVFDDDRLIGLCALREGGRGEEDILDLSAALGGETLRFRVPEGRWTLCALLLTRNRGPHRDYINMMSAASCRCLIDAVYEPHWARYRERFGTTIAGFFSDEPEIGNGHLYEMGKPVWQMEDQAWSDEVSEEMAKALGPEWTRYLPLLWERDFSSVACARVRLAYMDAVTRLVECNFSEQIGDWCRAHGVRYIGHLIEDNDQHTRTGFSLGHYFRGLGGQDMAGIDDIGGQVLPQGERDGDPALLGAGRGGRFYHYVLGRLGASLAVLDPRKKGDCLCEIFGNYGWEEGVRLEKYLADHFLVRGVNHFVPHAFSMKQFPDPDCPPHFFAHGHNPQFRHFGALMAYMNRMCDLVKSGAPQADVAVLYSAESDWMGRCAPLGDLVEGLARGQISYDFLPADVFGDPERYQADLSRGLRVNGREYKALVLPACDFLPPCAEEVLPRLREAGVRVIDAGRTSPLILPRALREIGLRDAQLFPPCGDIRVLHGLGEKDYWIFVNEGTAVWEGFADVPGAGPCFLYDAWRDAQGSVPAEPHNGGTRLSLTLQPLHSVVVVFGEAPDSLPRLPEPFQGTRRRLVEGWRRSVCTAAAYPEFTDEKEIFLPDDLAEERPQFSGFVRYEREVVLEKVPARAAITITDAYEGVELFVNGNSLGIQIAPPFRYELTPCLRAGANRIRIEVATTLEREMASQPDRMRAFMGLGPKKPTCPSGLNGQVIWEQMDG